MFKVVFFDLVGTLVRPLQPIGRQYAEVARRWGADLEAETLDRAFHQAMRETPEATPSPGSPGAVAEAERRWWRELVRKVVVSGGDSGPLARPEVFERYFDELYEHFTTANAWVLYDDTLPALDRLASAGMIAGLITNYDTRVYKVLDALGLTSRLDSVAIPANAGASKPAPQIFAHALQQQGVRAGEALHVGDSLGDDFEGARGAGLQALLLDREGRYAGEPGVARIDTLGALSRVL